MRSSYLLLRPAFFNAIPYYFSDVARASGPKISVILCAAYKNASCSVKDASVSPDNEHAAACKRRDSIDTS
jgi:hypothetical protein